MADRKYHWAVPVLDPSKRRYAWKAYAGGHYAQACGRKPALVLGDTAAQFVAKVKTDPDWYCSDCAKAARLALAAESAPKADTRSDSDRYAELRKLVEAVQIDSKLGTARAALDALLDWRHR